MIDYKYADLFLQDSKDKQLLIEFDSGTITNKDFHSENFELNESLCSEKMLRFGSCEASSIKFKVSYIFMPLKDKWLTVTETLDGNTDVPFSYGKYKVNSDKPTADRSYRDIIAYDAMYDIISADVTTWYNTVLPNSDSTVTLKQFRDSFFSHFGIEQEDISLPNDEMTVTRTIDPEKLSGKTVITSICEINGCFGHIGRNGKFRYVFLEEMTEGLYPSDTLYPRDDLYPADPMNAVNISKSHYISARYEDFKFRKINKLQIRQEENDIGCIYGTGDNCYIVQDNFLVYGKSHDELTEIAGNMYAVICKVWYRPAHVEAVGNPCLEVGDGIKLRTRYDIVYTYILQRTLKGIQALRDTYDADGEEYQREDVNSVHESIIQLQGKTNKLVRTVDETILEMGDMEQNLSAQIAINAQQILLKVSKDSIISEINQTAEKITISAQKIDLNGLVNADELVSKFATIATLNATSANLQNLIAQKASIESLNATNAVVSGKLNASEFTADNISAMSITVKAANVTGGFNASKITAGTISVERLDIDGIISGIASKSVQCITMTGQTVRASSFQLYNGSGYTSLSALPITINGTSYRLLGYTT